MTVGGVNATKSVPGGGAGQPPGASRVAIHGHAYQPPRADPRTGIVPGEPTAAPYHDWNERITAESYRSLGFARILDDGGRIVRIVNCFERMSFNLGPTLAHWLAAESPQVHDRIVEGDRVGRTAIAHPYHHAILPLGTRSDARTEIQWGLADFRFRFGREPVAMWLPETAVDERTMALLAEAGLQFVILAPHQVDRVPPPGTIGRWRSVDGSSSLDVVVYDGPSSHEMAFGPALTSSARLMDLLSSRAPDGVVVAATDAETFGHHHRFSERGVAYALFEEGPRRGIEVGAIAELVVGVPRHDVGRVRATAWSCAHGLGRWSLDCGCSTDGEPGWNQRWRTPLRQALDMTRARAHSVYARRGGAVFNDAIAARDAYGAVLADPAAWDQFVEDHVRPLASEEEARLLLAMQGAVLASYTSCAWFFGDLARREVAIVLQEAELAQQLMTSLGEDAGVPQFLEILGEARSNDDRLPTGREVWLWATGPLRSGGSAVLPGAPLRDLVRDLTARCVGGDVEAARQAVAVVEAVRRAGEVVDVDEAQELVYDALRRGRHGEHVARLGTALGLAVDVIVQQSRRRVREAARSAA
jgi:hypothetical protein